MGSVRLPVFPLGMVLFPGTLLPLHVFEQRYRRMITELLEQPEGTRWFGIVAIRAGREVGDLDGHTDLFDTGCVADLRRVVVRPDGRFDIVVGGRSRFRLRAGTHEVAPDGLLSAQVDIRVPDGAAGPAAHALVPQVVRLLADYREALGRAEGVSGDTGPHPPTEPEALAWAVARALVVDVTDKQQMLATGTVDELLHLQVRLLRREIGLLRHLGARAGVELPRVHYSAN
ncbi:LON peptidase substrate-binding domain-containing protein [Nakamurella leprariae]|uniref:LON peptidase substrate-binding domain-containing protein n=1 Tax=Nakamurella leprariae TaxID=2803911 RepID=A0A938YJB7_9ACTN|nr:LON peptidase substrate-binding domain-containing protein [Nakamurella leprariae]MBM9468845.1 LON peptidase substrate-binding domain-containing protein [Nakamurella leprariae]